MAITFRSLPKGSTIGSGSYVFRHYGEKTVEIPDYLCYGLTSITKVTDKSSSKNSFLKISTFSILSDNNFFIF